MDTVENAKFMELSRSEQFVLHGSCGALGRRGRVITGE